MKYLLLTFLTIVCSSCGLVEKVKPSQTENEVFFYETGDTTFPVMALEESQTAYFFSEDLKSIRVSFSDGTEWDLKFSDQFLPTKLIQIKGDEIRAIIFGTFEEDFTDVAIFTNDNSLPQYYFDIEFSGISENALNVSVDPAARIGPEETHAFDFKTWLEDYGKFISSTLANSLSGIGCGSAILATLASEGVFLPTAF
jgi:hypothetical protein